MNIGVFGGSFDPPHIGHLILAKEAAYQLQLDKVLWVVTSHPPHKRNISLSPVDIRLKLVAAAIEGEPAFEISRVDIDRPAPHYALDTVRLIKQQYIGSKLIYLMGGDSLRDLPLWYEAQQFLDLCDGIGVKQRLDEAINMDRLESYFPGISKKVILIDSPLIDVSSHDLRERIAAGRPYRYYLSPPVYNIIKENDIYKS